jgi:hypothetical protein
VLGEVRDIRRQRVFRAPSGLDAGDQVTSELVLLVLLPGEVGQLGRGEPMRAERFLAHVGPGEVLEVDVHPQGDGGGADRGQRADRHVGEGELRAVTDEGGLVELRVGGRCGRILPVDGEGRGDGTVPGQPLQAEQTDRTQRGGERGRRGGLGAAGMAHRRLGPLGLGMLGRGGGRTLVCLHLSPPDRRDPEGPWDGGS